MSDGGGEGGGKREREGGPRHAERGADEHVRAVRAGHGANCSSIGSVVDLLFAAATVGTALFAAVTAALASEPVRVAGAGAAPKPPSDRKDEERIA